MTIVTVGVDLAKPFIAAHGVHATGNENLSVLSDGIIRNSSAERSDERRLAKATSNEFSAVE